MDDGADGARFEVLLHGGRFSEAEDVAVVELAVAAQGLVEGGGADAVQGHVVDGVLGEGGPGEVGHGRGRFGQGGGPMLGPHGDPGQGLSCPPGQLGDVAAGFRSAVSEVGADVHEVHGAGPVQQAVEVGGEDAVPLRPSGQFVGALQVERHEAGRRRTVRQDALVDVEHEDLVEIEPPAFQQAEHLQAGEGFAFEVHGVLAHPPLQLGPGIGQFGFASQALHAPDVQGHDVPESGPGSRQPRIADVVFRVHGPGGHGFEND